MTSFPAGDGFRVLWTDHLVPFQRSASVRLSPVKVSNPPTASHRTAFEQKIPSSCAEFPVLGITGAGMYDHCSPELVCCQISASGEDRDPPLYPTAMQREIRRYETDFNSVCWLAGSGGKDIFKLPELR